MINKLFTIINQFYVIVNKLFITKRVFLLIISKVDMKLNENLKVGYFSQSPKIKWGTRSSSNILSDTKFLIFFGNIELQLIFLKMTKNVDIFK